jgi:hypothetical protein
VTADILTAPMPAGYLMEAEEAIRFRRVFPAVIAVVVLLALVEILEAVVEVFFKALVAVLVAVVVEFFKALVVVLVAVVVEATTVRGVVNKTVMPWCTSSTICVNE